MPFKATHPKKKPAATRGQTEKVLFLAEPGRRHLIVELDEPYNRRELAVLLAAFRNRLAGIEDTVKEVHPHQTEPVDRIVGPGFIIDLMRRRQASR